MLIILRAGKAIFQDELGIIIMETKTLSCLSGEISLVHKATFIGQYPTDPFTSLEPQDHRRIDVVKKRRTTDNEARNL